MAAVWSSCRLLEFDYSGIEQVVMGWCMQDPRYIGIAKLGTHAFVASGALAREKDTAWVAADISWPVDQLAPYLKSIKSSTDPHVNDVYDQSKRCVHGTAYGLTTHGMVRNFPKIFPTLKLAESTQRIYFELAPGVPIFHQSVRQTAYDQRYLGGAAAYQYLPDARKVVGHPYGYQHWFWSVVTYQRLTELQRIWRAKRHQPYTVVNGIPYAETLGEDSKRAIAFYPQSIARGVLTEACFPLFDPEDPLAERCYVGDLYYGETPLRAPIHDSLFFECPTRKVDQLIDRVAYAMQRPIEAMPCPADWGLGAYLTVGVDAKIGEDWGHMTKLPLPSLTDLGVANDAPYTPAEAQDEEDVLDLERRVG